MSGAIWRFEATLLEELAKRGLEGELAKIKATNMLEIIARPQMGRNVTPQSFTVPHWDTKRPSWHNCWWARLVRWVNERVFRRTATSMSPLPAWLHDLVYTYEVDLRPQVETLPVDILERIKVMCRYLTCHQWDEPTKVIMGRRAFSELQGVCISHFPDSLTFTQDPGGSVKIFGLSVRVNPFLAEDAVLVC